MPIQPLPADARRLLCAGTLVTTPVRLVQELVDNAIDAGATAVDVLVSANTVDKVEVRDSGHGIARADWPVLGCRGHTSKLRRFDDLAAAAGRSLGFRGEGLASARALGRVSLTTRTAADAVAATFCLASGGTDSTGGTDSGGCVAGTCKSVAAPVGTTVSVAGLFAALPVRRTAAVRDAQQTVAAVRALLCGYALARPQLRLSFRVFQSPPSSTWSYRPTPPAMGAGGRVNDAVVMLFGAEAARQCQDVVVSAADLRGRGQATLDQVLSGNPPPVCGTGGGGGGPGLSFEACLPRPDADLSKLALGGFVSVDGRPLSSAHPQGLARKLLAIFRASVGAAADADTVADADRNTPPAKRHHDVFLRLNIRCPAGSYDANVEASKSDVLFVDEAGLCDAFRRLCARLYGEKASSRGRSQQQQDAGRPARAQIRPACPALPTPARQSAPVTLGRSREQPQRSSPSGPPRSLYAHTPPRATGPGPRVAGSRSAASSQASPRFVSARGYNRLPTPPPSSPVEQHIRRRAPLPNSGSPARGLRQAMIAFGRRPPDSGSTATADVASTGSPGRLSTERPTVAERPDATRPTDAERRPTDADRPVCALAVDMQQLRRSAARFARRARAQDGDLAYLAPDDADIAQIEERLRAAVADWLARSRPATTGDAPVQVDLYLRKSLKSKALVVRM